MHTSTTTWYHCDECDSKWKDKDKCIQHEKVCKKANSIKRKFKRKAKQIRVNSTDPIDFLLKCERLFSCYGIECTFHEFNFKLKDIATTHSAPIAKWEDQKFSAPYNYHRGISGIAYGYWDRLWSMEKIKILSAHRFNTSYLFDIMRHVDGINNGTGSSGGPKSKFNVHLNLYLEDFPNWGPEMDRDALIYHVSDGDVPHAWYDMKIDINEIAERRKQLDDNLRWPKGKSRKAIEV